MCGIAGVVGRESRSADQWSVLADMSAAIAHRGPDDHGFFISGPVGLAHRRLSIIDIAGGRQPMIDAERGRVLVYNGELYNFQALRAAMQASGTRFATRSDTEVLLRAADTSSFDWLRTLNGMFAFALWDESSRRLVLARDRLGIKPLYYAAFPDEFVFASEIKALLRHPRLRRDVNVARIPEYLAFRSLAGVETMFKGICQVPPGHVLTVAQQDLTPQMVPFWTGPGETSPQDIPEAECLDRLQAVLTDSVQRQLVSDVPVGTYLSGGVDSSLITVLARSLRPEETLHTFSVGFEERGFDESEYARRVAQQVGATHHALVITESDYVAQLEATVRQLDEPLNHAHTVQLQLLSRYAKSLVTVVLTGEGADELFGGYPRLQIPLVARGLQRVPAAVGQAMSAAAAVFGLRRIVKLLEASSTELDAILHGARFVPQHDFRRLYPAALPLLERRELLTDLQGTPPVERVLRFDQRTYLPSLLSRLDKTSMSAAVECRVPFLDNEVIDYSFCVPSSMKIRLWRENKVALKRVAARLLPHDVIYRRKVGFGTPLAKWMRNAHGLGRYLDLLAGSTSRTRACIDGAAVSRLVESHRNGAQDHSEILWGLLSLELWWRTVVEQTDLRSDLATGGSLWHHALSRLDLPSVGGHPVMTSHSGMTV